MPFNTIEDALAALAKQAMLGPVLQDSLSQSFTLVPVNFAQSSNMF